MGEVKFAMEDTAFEKKDEGDRVSFKINEFEGPLDLLLFLIKKNEINIYDIPIAEITEQYIGYLSYSASIDLDSLTEFYSLAATLLFIKSRMLLPVDLDSDEEFDDPRKELVDKLIEYQKFKKLTDIMAEKENEMEWVIERQKLQRTLPFEEEGALWDEIKVWDLLKTFSSLMNTLSSERIIDLYEEVTINEKITLVNEILEKKGNCLFTELLVHKESVMDIVCAFLAILEMVKMKSISIFQHRMFGDIMIKVYDREKVNGNPA
jgi:segregation and condensation protein A